MFLEFVSLMFWILIGALAWGLASFFGGGLFLTVLALIVTLICLWRIWRIGNR